MKKKVSIVAAIIFFAVGVYFFCSATFGSYGSFAEGLLYSFLPFGLSVLFLMLGSKSSKNGKEGKVEDAEFTLRSLRDKGVLSEEEYQNKLKMLRSGVQKSMDDLKSLKDAGIITEEEYQQKVKQL